MLGMQRSAGEQIELQERHDKRPSKAWPAYWCVLGVQGRVHVRSHPYTGADVRDTDATEESESADTIDAARC